MKLPRFLAWSASLASSQSQSQPLPSSPLQARPLPGAVPFILPTLAFALPLHAQEMPPTPATATAGVYSGTSAQPDGEAARHHGRGRASPGRGISARGNNGRGIGREDGGNGGGRDSWERDGGEQDRGERDRDERDRGDHGDKDDGRNTFGMSVVTLGPDDAEPDETPSLAARLQSALYAAYVGGGVGNVVAHYPASSGSMSAFEAFAGARLKYAGIEASWDTLGYYGATLDNQPVQIATDLFSASLLGFLPLGGNADFYLRYGRTAWNVTANTPIGPLPDKSGTNALMGAGIEFRRKALLIRVETKRFRNVFQSNSYNYTGLSVGGYFY